MKINVSALIAERKILEAMAEGRFDKLPGRGKPQKLEDLSRLPEDLRLAYTVLKNSGFLEEDESGATRMPDMRDLMARCDGREYEAGGLERLKFLLSRSAKKPEKSRLDLENRIEAAGSAYVDKIVARLGPPVKEEN